MEESLARLRKCSHPGSDRQIGDLERHIAYARAEAHKTWSPARARQRLAARLQGAKSAVDKTSARQKELMEQQEELTKAIAEAAERAARQAAAVAEHQAALDTFDQAAPAPGGAAERREPAASGGSAGSAPVAAESGGPSGRSSSSG